MWRRSFDVTPPRITPLNPYFEAIMCNPHLRHIPQEIFPEAETLATTMERVLECWATAIEPEIRAGRRVLIVAHGTSLRGLVKHLSGEWPIAIALKTFSNKVLLLHFRLLH